MNNPNGRQRHIAPTAIAGGVLRAVSDWAAPGEVSINKPDLFGIDGKGSLAGKLTNARGAFRSAANFDDMNARARAGGTTSPP